MLKKVLCLLLVLACSVALFACGGDGNGAADLGGAAGDGVDKSPSGDNTPADKETDKELVDDKTTVDYAREQAFFTVVNNSRYNLITTKTETWNSLLEGETCIGFYETTVFGEDHYSYYYWAERFNNIGESENGQIKSEREPHTILYKDGEYFYDGNKVSENPDPNALNVKFALDTECLGSYTISEDGTILTTKISAADVEELFGVVISATSEVDLKIEIRGSSLYMTTLDYYCGKNGVHMETSYIYDPNVNADLK